MVDVIILTKFLSPFLPYLLKLGDKAASEAANKFGGEAWEKAKAIWSKLRPKVEAKEEAKVAVQQVAAKPESEARQLVLQEELETLLKHKPDLATVIAQIMESDAAAHSDGTDIKVQGQNTQTAGDNAKQIGQIGQAGNISL